MTPNLGSRRVIALSSVLSCVVSVHLATAQSLGDVARDEAARRKSASTGKVYTNANLPAVAAAPVAAAPQGAPAAAAPQTKPDGAASATKPGDKSEPVKKDEKYWREAFKVARDDIKRAEDQVTILQLELNRVNRDYLQRSDVYNREYRIGAEITDVKARLDLAQKEVEVTRRKLALLEEEFRRSGAPAGWAR